jgi:hypothetical protein
MGEKRAQALPRAISACALALLLAACGERAAQTSSASATATEASASPENTTAPSDPSAVPPPTSAPPPPRPRGPFVDDPEANIQIATFRCASDGPRTKHPCPMYVMDVERTGALHFQGTAFVREADARDRLSESEARALFALVNEDVWGPPIEGSAVTHREAPPVRFLFRFAGGTREITGDPRCSTDGRHTDRFTLPTPLCALEQALQKVALPFTDCDGKRCPSVPDAATTRNPKQPPLAAGMGVLVVDCPTCLSVSIVRLDGSSPEKKLGKSPKPVRVSVPAGRYTVVRRYARGSRVSYPTVPEGEEVLVRSTK